MATTIEQIRESKKNIITIVQEKIDLSGDYNFRQIAKLREHKREELQPCDDETVNPNQNKKSLSMKIYLFIKKAQAAWKTIAKK